MRVLGVTEWRELLDLSTGRFWAEQGHAATSLFVDRSLLVQGYIRLGIVASGSGRTHHMGLAFGNEHYGHRVVKAMRRTLD